MWRSVKSDRLGMVIGRIGEPDERRDDELCRGGHVTLTRVSVGRDRGRR
jgi:hypothetical protein